MTNVDQAVGQPPAGNTDELRESAAGWQKIQFTVLGFIGLCGVLKGIGTATGPRSLQIVAAVLIVAALLLACCAIFLVGRVAWPVRSAGMGPRAGPGGAAPRQAARSLRTGLALTVVTLILASLAATSSWWPAKASGAHQPSSAPAPVSPIAEPGSAAATACWSCSCPGNWCPSRSRR